MGGKSCAIPSLHVLHLGRKARDYLCAVSIRRIKINRLLVPTDFSSLSLQALEYAVFLGARFKADIDALHVLESGQSRESESGNSLAEASLERVHSQWAQITGHLPVDPSIRFQAHVDQGKIHECILDKAANWQSDLLVMGTHGILGMNPLTRFFLGSNANRTAANIQIPALTLREIPRPLQWSEILLPLDLTKQTRGKVQFAINLARLFSSRLHLLAVADYFETLQRKTGSLELMLEEQAAIIRSNGLDCSTEVIRHDDVAHAVVGYGEEINADLTVIVTAEEGKLDSLLMGSRASRVIATSRRPVLSLRPANLKSILQD